MEELQLSSPTGSPAGSTRRPGRSGTLRWQLIAATIIVVGLVLSGALGTWRSSTVRGEHQKAFEASADDVATTLATQLRRNADFVTTLRAVLTDEPPMTTGTFQRWFTRLQGAERESGGLGTTIVEVVPSSAARMFVARRNADPAFRALVRGKVQALRSTGSSLRCLVSAGAAVAPVTEANTNLIQEDWCDPRSGIGSGQTAVLQRATDSRQSIVLPVASGNVRTVLYETAFYRAGARLASVAERRASVRGWIIGSFDLAALARSAQAMQHGFAITVVHTSEGRRAEVVARLKGRPGGSPGSYTATLHLDGTWQIGVSGQLFVTGMSAEEQGLIAFLTGAIVTVLLAALLAVLARSRGHALAMVEQRTRELRHQALHDALTGLPNRVLALDRAEQMLARARRQGVPVAALYVDVDGFKHVNDSFGHAAGDALLRAVARRLESVVREGDTAARLGGDEFVVLVEGSTLDAGPELVAERLLEVLRAPYDLDGESGRPVSLSASVGIASGLRESADELLRDADLALYEAKSAGRNRHVTFDSGMQTAAQDRLMLQLDLIEAIGEGQLLLLYQPIFDLRSESQTGAEALVRWQHPTRGLLGPDAFIPVAEESGLILPLGQWVLNEACAQAAGWAREGHNLSMCVNVSARQLDSDELIDDVRSALEDSGLEPCQLTLEVTETALMRDAEATAARLFALKELGVHIAIDDFGTGYSSLAYLRQFPVDLLKIDRSFIKGVASPGRSDTIVDTLVELGRTLGIDTLAEGIEEPAQLKMLQAEECDLGQGFLLGRPLSPTAMRAFLDQRHQPGVSSLDRV